MIAEGAKIIAPTLVWTMDQGYQFTTHITQLSAVEKAIFCWTPKEFDLERFMNDLVAKKNNDCFFSITLPRATVFFKSTFIEHGNSQLKFSVPLKVFKVQRRQNLRHHLLKDPKAWAEHPDPLFPEKVMKRKIFDISAGGLSFIVVSQDAPLYPAGLLIENFKFTLQGRDITSTVEVRHVKPLTGAQKDMGTKVGISFKRISTTDSEFIAAFVFEESRKMFSKFM